jgi:large subunit ribosomal protein L23
VGRVTKAHPHEILLHPYVTEKTMNFLEGTAAQNMKDGNRLEFIVRREATKKQIREAFEAIYEVKVARVNTYIHKDGKHAIIKLRPEFRAEEVAMRIGVY